jgi:hypothetical protein
MQMGTRLSHEILPNGPLNCQMAMAGGRWHPMSDGRMAAME